MANRRARRGWSERGGRRGRGRGREEGIEGRRPLDSGALLVAIVQILKAHRQFDLHVAPSLALLLLPSPEEHVEGGATPSPLPLQALARGCDAREVVQNAPLLVLEDLVRLGYLGRGGRVKAG